jgi:hypothetical protein
MAQIKRLVASAQGRDRGPEPIIVVNILGYRLQTKSGHVFCHPDMEPIVVSTVQPVATAEQKAEALRLYRSALDAPQSYAFPASRLPLITDGPPEAEPTQFTTTNDQETE